MKLPCRGDALLDKGVLKDIRGRDINPVLFYRVHTTDYTPATTTAEWRPVSEFIAEQMAENGQTEISVPEPERGRVVVHPAAQVALIVMMLRSDKCPF